MVSKREILQHFETVMDEMMRENPFFEYYWQSPYELDDMFGAYYDMPENLAIEFGATRGTIVDDDYDWVVKFDTMMFEDDSPCEMEYYNYKAAKAANLSQYFAEVHYIGTYTRTIHTWDMADFGNFDCTNSSRSNFISWTAEHMSDEDKIDITISIPLYAMRKAHHIGDVGISSTEVREKVASYDSPLIERNEDIGCIFFQKMEESEYEELSMFLRENRINDIHSGNVGWVDDDFVLIDYAGYHDGDSDF